MITEKIAEFIVGTTYGDIAADAVAVGKKGVLDYIGVAVAGSRERAGEIITRFVKKAGGTPEASVIGAAFKSSPFMAAFANGAMGHALDFDDESETWNSHPSVAILPAVLALGEGTKASGKDILTAYIVGWEVAARIGASTFFKIFERGFHLTPLVGTMSATSAAARLMRLKMAPTMTALGIGASQASGLAVNFGTDTKPLHAGLAASNGVRAVQLARNGFTACSNVLDGPAGYFKTFSGEEYDASKLEGLGKTWDITTALCIKAYPCCYCNQRPIDSMFYLMRKYGIRAQDVEAVEFKAYPLQIKASTCPRPKSALEAKFSLPYALAAALVYGEAGLGQFTDAAVLNPAIQEFLPRVKIVPIPGKSLSDYTHCAPGQLVTVRLKNGQEYSYDALAPKGHAANPMTWEEVAAKFRACTEGTLSKKNIERCIALIAQLEKVKDINELMPLVTKAR